MKDYAVFHGEASIIHIMPNHHKLSFRQHIPSIKLDFKLSNLNLS